MAEELGGDLGVVGLGEGVVAAEEDGHRDGTVGAADSCFSEAVAEVEVAAAPALLRVGRAGLRGVLHVEDDGPPFVAREERAWTSSLQHVS